MRHVKNRNLLIAGVIIASAVFVIDINTPLGIADAVSYVALVLLTLWSSRKSHTIMAASVATVLTMLGMLMSPTGEGISIFVTNRILALIGIWTAAFVILQFKRTEAEGRKMRDNLDALFTHAKEGIIITKQSGKIDMINPEVEALFGYKKSELVGSNLSSLLRAYTGRHSPYSAGKTETTLKQKETLQDKERVGIRKDGTEFPLEITTSNYLLEGEEFEVSFLVDISERKKQEEEIANAHEELQQYSRILKETNAELENFAYISSHDLQEPLRKIQSFGDRLQTKEAAVLSIEGKDYLTRMLNAASRMQLLINDLLRFSRLSSVNQSYVNVDLNKLAVEVLSDMEVTIASCRAHIQIELLPEIFGEPTQIRQVFQNLIGNAIKFRRDNVEPIVHISSRNIVRDGVELIELCFEDNGTGFEEKYAEKIFGIFQRLDGAKFQGTGIGLTICKKIMTRHGGTIVAKSRLGKGSTFFVTFPLNQSNQKIENYVAQVESH